ncbi:MAG: tRNA pseudouridine(55) synthase TruB [Saprospiraceae bacterium]|nr:tRNA pseudouridine(55) synthase TruB [Saprospiraceae bacterium]
MIPSELTDTYHILSKEQSFPDLFPPGAILLIDKPLAWTSFDVVKKVRGALVRRTGLKKLKVGHAGTLDPLATGLLIVCVGNYTRLIDTLQAMSKSYSGVITLGATTPSFDLEKGVDTTFPTDQVTNALLQEKRLGFVGDILQVPPIFSAVKVDGKRLYKNARTGEEVELPHRPVQIASFELSQLRPVPAGGRTEAIIAGDRGATIMLHPDYPEGVQVDFEVVCSKGTYIRSLANDLGQAVGSGGYLSSLRRTGSGGFSAADAWEVEELISWIRGEK